jgi:hypothetical protein
MKFSNVSDVFSYKYLKTYKYANIGMIIIIDDLKYYKVLDTCINHDTGEKMLLILVCTKEIPVCDHINRNINRYKIIMSYDRFEKLCMINKEAYYQTFTYSQSQTDKMATKIYQKEKIIR